MEKIIDLLDHVTSKGIYIDYQPDQPTVDYHRHTFIEIFYVLNGKIEHHFNNTTEILQQGNFRIIDKEQFHKFVSIPNETCSLINCLFVPSFIDDSLSPDDNTENVLSCHETPFFYMFNDFSQLFQLFHEDNNLIKNLLLAMYSEFFDGKFGYLDILKRHLISLLVYITRFALINNSAPDTRNVINQAIDYMNKYFYRKITLEEVSRKFNYTPQHFSVKFKQETGISFSEYLQKIRINKSCVLLRETNMKITEIANKIGYQDIRYFEKLFRKHINRTPLQHRQFYRQNK